MIPNFPGGNAIWNRSKRIALCAAAGRDGRYTNRLRRRRRTLRFRISQRGMDRARMQQAELGVVASGKTQMPTIDRDGVQIYYEVHGSGPPLLLTHGYSSTCGMWQGQIAALSKHHKLVLWDMRGHGRSAYPEESAAYSEALTVADMAALLDAVGAEQAIVGGLSLGGYMSLAFYRSHPDRVRALLIIDTGPGFKKDDAREAWNKRAHDTGDRFE